MLARNLKQNIENLTKKERMVTLILHEEFTVFLNYTRQETEYINTKKREIRLKITIISWFKKGDKTLSPETAIST